MAEDTPVSNIVIPAIQGLALAINQTYTYANNSLFGAIIPNFYRDFYERYVKVSAGWLDGYVYSLHSQSGIISTRIGSKLITGLTKQIVGEQLIFKKASKEDDYKALRFISDLAKAQDFMKAIYAGVGYALGIGTSLLKINRKMNGDLWLEAVRFDNCFYLSTFSNEIEEATFFIRGYTDTREGKGNQQFILCEHRFYDVEETGKIVETENGFEVSKPKGKKTAMVEYKVYQARGTTFNNLMQSGIDSKSVTWQEMPHEIRKMIKNDFAVLEVGKPQKLGLPNLGVVALRNGEMDLSIPTGTSFGEGMLIGIQDDLITYEVASSYLLRDMYLAKGTVYTPKDLNITDYNPNLPQPQGVMSGIGDNKIELIRGVSPDQQKIIVEQFQIRAVEWQTVKENALKNIGVKWGMSPKILASFLAVSSVTATQIDSEDDMSIAFISHTRAYFKNDLNKLIETILNYYGMTGNVEIDFGTPSLVNKDRILDRTIKELENGLIDIDEAIRIINPDLDEEALQAKIEKAKKAREEMFIAQQTEFNEEGGFGNDYDDLGGANLNGSTMPIQ